MARSRFPWNHRVLGACPRDRYRCRPYRRNLTPDGTVSGGTKAVQSALEGGESVVDVRRSKFQRLTKLSYLSGGKSLCNIENNARPNKERVNGSCGIDREIRVRLFKSFPLVIVHLRSRPTLSRWQAGLVCPSLPTASRPVTGEDRGLVALANQGKRRLPMTVPDDVELRSEPVPSLGTRGGPRNPRGVREAPPLRED